MPQKPHTIPSTPHRGSGVLPAMVSVAAVCDRRRPQGRDAAPSGSHSRGSAAGSAVVPDGPLPCSTGVVRLWSAKPTPSGPPVIVPTGGRCSVSAQASGAASAVLSHAGRRDASPTSSRGSAAGNAVVPDGPLPCSTGVPPVIVPTGGRCSVSAQASGAASAVLSHAGRRDASPTSSRGCAAGSAVVPDGPLPCSTGVVRLWSLLNTPPGPLVIDSNRRSAASLLDARLSSLDSSPSSFTRHSRFAASYHE